MVIHNPNGAGRIHRFPYPLETLLAQFPLHSEMTEGEKWVDNVGGDRRSPCVGVLQECLEGPGVRLELNLLLPTLRQPGAEHRSEVGRCGLQDVAMRGEPSRAHNECYISRLRILPERVERSSPRHEAREVLEDILRRRHAGRRAEPPGEGYPVTFKLIIIIDIEEGKSLCTICNEKPSNVLIRPCNHGGCCEDCIINCMKNNSVCPHCNEIIGKVYVIELDKTTKKYMGKKVLTFAY